MRRNFKKPLQNSRQCNNGTINYQNPSVTEWLPHWLADNAQPKLVSAESWNWVCTFLEECRWASKVDFWKFPPKGVWKEGIRYCKNFLFLYWIHLKLCILFSQVLWVLRNLIYPLTDLLACKLLILATNNETVQNYLFKKTTSR